MNIVPVNFSTKHRAMLGNVKKCIDKGHVAIDPDLFPELLTELRIATSDEEMSLDKTDYSMDLIALDFRWNILFIDIWLVGQLYGRYFHKLQKALADTKIQE